MTAYLKEVEYAASNLISLLWEEQTTLRKLKFALGPLERETSEGYERVAFLENNFDDPDDIMLATAGRYENYFGPDKEAHRTRIAITETQGRLQAHEFSVAALAGALLQLAKQGMSMVHGPLTGCPSGRSIGSQGLKSVVWQGRNQAQHWEMGYLNKPVTECFAALASDFDPKFRDYLKRSLAMDVVELLGWKSFVAFEQDLGSLG